MPLDLMVRMVIQVSQEVQVQQERKVYQVRPEQVGTLVQLVALVILDQ